MEFTSLSFCCLKEEGFFWPQPWRGNEILCFAIDHHTWKLENFEGIYGIGAAVGNSMNVNRAWFKSLPLEPSYRHPLLVPENHGLRLWNTTFNSFALKATFRIAYCGKSTLLDL